MGEDPMSNLADRDGYMEDFGKIDLHLHLDGSLPAETILKLAGKDHIGLPSDTAEGLIWGRSWKREGLNTRKFALRRSFTGRRDLPRQRRYRRRSRDFGRRRKRAGEESVSGRSCAV